jgi:outer membrane autotransporter protein
MLVGQTLNDVVKATTSLTLNAIPTVTDNSALLNFEFVQDGNNIDLNVVEGKTIRDSTLAGGGNSNAGSAATVLQAIQDGGANPAMNPVFTALNGLQTDEQVADAVNSFTPVTTTASVGAGTQIANSIQGIVELRQNVNVGGASGGLNSGDPLFADRNFWLKPFGSWGEQQSKSGLNGFDLKTRGIGFGLDGEYAKNQKLGFAFFYTGADVDVKNMAQKADINVYSALLYGNVPVFDDKTNFLFQAGYTAQKTDTSRFIALTGATAKGDYTAKVASLDLKLMRDVQISERLLLQPIVSVTYRHLKNPSYSEKGAGALNQDVDRFTSSQTTLGIGARMHYMLDDASKLMANVNYGRDLKSNALSVSTAFEGAPGVKYQSRGIDNGRNNYELGLGYERSVGDRSTINVMYTHQAQGSSFKNDAISATYNLKF